MAGVKKGKGGSKSKGSKGKESKGNVKRTASSHQVWHPCLHPCFPLTGPCWQGRLFVAPL